MITFNIVGVPDVTIQVVPDEDDVATAKEVAKKSSKSYKEILKRVTFDRARRRYATPIECLDGTVRCAEGTHYYLT